MVEDVINNLEEAKEDLLRLASEVGARKLDLRFPKSEGEAAEELLAMSRKLQSCGQAFADVVRRTAEKLDYTADTFKEMDDSLNY